MPFTADQIIGKKLFAKQPVSRLSYSFNKTGTIQPGFVGVVFSYVTRPDGVYWIITGGPSGFLVKHEPTKLSLDPVERKQLEIKQQAQKEKELIETKGVIPFYIEKYGRWVLIAGVASIVLKSVLNQNR
jgi:hypothetical protein